MSGLDRLVSGKRLREHVLSGHFACSSKWPLSNRWTLTMNVTLDESIDDSRRWETPDRRKCKLALSCMGSSQSRWNTLSSILAARRRKGRQSGKCGCLQILALSKPPQRRIGYSKFFAYGFTATQPVLRVNCLRLVSLRFDHSDRYSCLQRSPKPRREAMTNKVSTATPPAPIPS